MPMGLHIRYRIIVVKIDKNYKKSEMVSKSISSHWTKEHFFVCKIEKSYFWPHCVSKYQSGVTVH